MTTRRVLGWIAISPFLIMIAGVLVFVVYKAITGDEFALAIAIFLAICALARLGVWLLETRRICDGKDATDNGAKEREKV